MKTSSIPRRVALAALILAAACTDRTPTESAAPTGREVSTQIACTASVADARVRCGAPAGNGGPAESIILGGQGTYLRLESSNVAYDSAADVFSLDVTVQNLLSQQMGTPDGTAVSGVQVFFEQEPVATEGSGEVTVANADGEDSFTRTAQPYFDYPQILEPRGTSLPRTWRFDVPASVQEFRFTVYVRTELPAEQGTLRWTQERGYVSTEPVGIEDIWGAGPSSMFAVADSVILHDDGTGWKPMPHPSAQEPLGDIYGNSRYEVFAVGLNGAVLEYDGNRWHLRARLEGSPLLRAVWSSGRDVYAAGWMPRPLGGGQMALVGRSHDGGDTWTTSTPATPGSAVLADVWASGDDVYAAGVIRTSRQPDRCLLMKSDDRGASWDSIPLPFTATAGCNLNAISGTGPGDVVVAGGVFNSATSLWEAVLLHSADRGATWQDTIIAGSNGRSVAALSPVPGSGTLYAAGYRGTLLRRDGDTWVDLTSNPPPTTGGGLGLFLSFTGVWAGSADNVHVVGFETRFRFDGSAWTREGIYVPTLEFLRSVHGGPSAVFAAGSRVTPQGLLTAVVLRDDGTGWTEAFAAPADSTRFTGVWSAGAGEAYAVGYQTHDDGGVSPLAFRYGGGGWTAMALPALDAGTVLDAVTGTGSGAVTVLGHAGTNTLVALRTVNGGDSWTRTDVAYPGGTTPTVAKAWAAGPNDVWAVGYRGDTAPGTATTDNEAFVLRYNGTTWSVSGTPGRVYRGVWSAGQDVFVSGYETAAGGGYRGFLRHSANGGGDWTEHTAPSTRSGGFLTDVWASSPTDVYVVGYGGTVLRWNGIRWVEGGGGAQPVLYGVWGSSGTNLYAVGDRGLIVHGTR